MDIIVRTIGISVVAVLGHVALVLAGGGADANIGAGLIVFGVLVVGSFVWALVDGLRERRGLGRLGVRWAAVAVAVPVVITLVLWGVNRAAPDWSGTSEMFVLWAMLAGMSFVPAIVGAAIGCAARPASHGTSNSLGPGQIRSS
ncbi:hypothetical protein [Knoellia subterranea]|uniref:Uncharacterized protein n=1 Tax=Knoellia subterranea KCTC 19937 TaxID=1385521 RepID=A0A0A0JQ03_9MICO|nr:hypothetical protein [Knoellia subterranea]KGN37681.1 hypothetical protein N803_11530 [Knoellia subterranea KCTC 19937]